MQLERKDHRHKCAAELLVFMTHQGETLTAIVLHLHGLNSCRMIMMRFGKVFRTNFKVTIMGQRTFAQLRTELYLSWRAYPYRHSNHLWSTISMKMCPVAPAELVQATSKSVLHNTFVLEKKIHKIISNQDEQKVLPIGESFVSNMDPEAHQPLMSQWQCMT